jgi:hypothetical protein
MTLRRFSRSNSRGRRRQLANRRRLRNNSRSREIRSTTPPVRESTNQAPNSPSNEQVLNLNSEFSMNNSRLGNAFPFEDLLNTFLEENNNKECNLIMGIGTSGSDNPKEILHFIEQQDENQRFFILLIDVTYRDIDDRIGRKSSITPFLEKDYSTGDNDTTPEEDKYKKANHPNGNRVYLWNKNIESNYRLNDFEEIIRQINEIKNDLNGPYEYGKRCSIESIPSNLQQFYLRLLTILRKPELRKIYVYNCAYENSGSYYLDVDNTYYSGPRFTRQRQVRISRFTGQPTGRYRFQYTTNQFFQYFCELLYILYKSNKPVYVLERTDERVDSIYILEKIRVYERVHNNNSAGGKRRRNYGTRKN